MLMPSPVPVSSVRALSFPCRSGAWSAFPPGIKGLEVYFSLEKLYPFLCNEVWSFILSCLCLLEVVFHLNRVSHPSLYLAAAALEKAGVLSLSFTAGTISCAQGLVFFCCPFSSPSALSVSAASRGLVTSEAGQEPSLPAQSGTRAPGARSLRGSGSRRRTGSSPARL